jgi:hypothetical protein
LGEKRRQVAAMSFMLLETYILLYFTARPSRNQSEEKQSNIDEQDAQDGRI